MCQGQNMIPCVSTALQDRATSIIFFLTCVTSSLYQVDIIRTQRLVTCKQKKHQNDCISGAIYVYVVKKLVYTY